MNILVTGASGFIGQSVCRKLLAEKHRVMGISRMQHTDTGLMQWIQSSLLLSDENLQRIQEFRPQVLIHLAWEKIPDFSFETSLENLQHQLHFFNAVLRTESLQKVIAAGSCWEYNLSFGECRTNAVCSSGNHFTWAKHSLHDYLQWNCKKAAISLIWARIFYVYGPGQREGALIPTLFRDIKNNSVPQLQNPNNANDFIYIDDVSNAFEKMVTIQTAQAIVNIGSGETKKVLDICRCVETEIKKNHLLTDTLETKTKQIPAATGFWADIKETMQLLNWHPAVSIEEGIAQIHSFNQSI